MNAANLFHYLSLTLAIVIGSVWAFRFVAMSLAVKRRAALGSRSHTDASYPTPRVSVLVAARDEEANIEACIRSLLDQDYPNYEVIAIDDRSTDRTPEILRRLESQAQGRLRVVTVSQPREGWAGKNNAMHEGIAVSDGDWLVLIDADCRQTSRRTLSVAMAEVADKRVDFLTIIPILDAPTKSECIIQPACSWVLILWFLPDRVNNPEKKTAYANGAFMLMSRACYDAIGGHERVRMELNEDIMMARWAKRAGFQLCVAQNEDLFVARMYPTLREAWRGWSRIFFGSLGTTRRILISLAMVGFYSLLPWIALAASTVLWSVSSGEAVSHWRLNTCAWLAVIVMQQAVTWRYNGLVGVGRWWSLLQIAGSCAAFAMLGNALCMVLGITRATWRGTTYRRAEDGGAIDSSSFETQTHGVTDPAHAATPETPVSAAPR